MVSSISTALGAGSGIDTKALIDSLAAAVREPKEALLARREAANKASVSVLGEVASAIDSFASALSSLISGGTLFSQPNVSDTTIMTATALPGARLGTLSAQLRVEQLAQGQTLASAPLTSLADPVGEGTLTLTTATGSFAVTIDGSNNSLDGLMKAVNAANSGVKASIIVDQGSPRLVLKSATGAAQAFTVGAAPGATSGLERFAFGPGVTGGMASTQSAQDAIVVMDGIEVRRGSNSFSDLVEGIQIDLKRAVPGAIVSIGVTRPTAAITQAVGDFVSAYNELHGLLAIATVAASKSGGDSGALRGDLSVRELQRQLAKLPATVLNSGGGPSTLAEIGVATNRDGTLSLNAFRLQTALEQDPEGVEQLFNPGQSSSSPFVQIASKVGKVKPGTYTITDMMPSVGGAPASAKIDGLPMVWSGSSLVAPAGSPALGLILKISASAASATVTIDPGLGGALQSIRDAIRGRTGPIANSQDRLSDEADSIADDREQLEKRSTAYYDQLVKNFTAMERRVSAFKATQSYLDQQIKSWNNGND